MAKATIRGRKYTEGALTSGMRCCRLCVSYSESCVAVDIRRESEPVPICYECQFAVERAKEFPRYTPARGDR